MRREVGAEPGRPHERQQGRRRPKDLPAGGHEGIAGRHQKVVVVIDREVEQAVPSALRAQCSICPPKRAQRVLMAAKGIDVPDAQIVSAWLRVSSTDPWMTFRWAWSAPDRHLTPEHRTGANAAAEAAAEVA